MNWNAFILKLQCHWTTKTLYPACGSSAQCQCTDERVNQITPKLFAVADNPYDMAKMTVEEIAAIIRPCGLVPMKSKGIPLLFEYYCNEYNEVGKLRSLEAMPSVGAQNGECSDESSFWGTCLSCGHPYSAVDVPLGILKWQIGRPDREGC